VQSTHDRQTVDVGSVVMVGGKMTISLNQCVTAFLSSTHSCMQHPLRALSAVNFNDRERLLVRAPSRSEVGSTCEWISLKSYPAAHRLPDKIRCHSISQGLCKKGVTQRALLIPVATFSNI
jgi:hypothetical protein